MTFALLLSVFVIATCGLVYELLAGTLASYLLGDSVTQFSTIIGCYLFAMGVGSYAAKFVRAGRGESGAQEEDGTARVSSRLVRLFVQVEILIGVLGGCSAAILFNLFDRVNSFRIPLYGMVFVIGALVGFEIPILMRLLRGRLEFNDLVSKVFAFDYVGALLASILFPLLLVPHLGLIRTAFLFGILNIAVALWVISIFRKEMDLRPLGAMAVGSICLLAVGFAQGERLTGLAEEAMYSDRVVFARSTPYQRIVVTSSQDDLRLFLNGHLQFSSKDEYRYHEALVHMGLASMRSPRRALVLGGGDGLAVRELLRYPSIEQVTLVEIDAEIARLFRTHPRLAALNGDALSDPRVTVVTADAFAWLKTAPRDFDFVVVDFPDPSNFSVGKLYTTTFFSMLERVLSENGRAVIQSASPYFARRSFWCIERTLREVGFSTLPYHAYVPSFGEWGFILAGRRPMVPPTEFPKGLRFLDAETADRLVHFPPDMDRLPADVNRLNNQILVRYYESEWAKVATN